MSGTGLALAHHLQSTSTPAEIEPTLDDDEAVPSLLQFHTTLFFSLVAFVWCQLRSVSRDELATIQQELRSLRRRVMREASRPPGLTWTYRALETLVQRLIENRAAVPREEIELMIREGDELGRWRRERLGHDAFAVERNRILDTLRRLLPEARAGPSPPPLSPLSNEELGTLVRELTQAWLEMRGEDLPPGAGWSKRQLVNILDRAIRGEIVHRDEVTEFINVMRETGEWRVEQLGEDAFADLRTRWVASLERWQASLPATDDHPYALIPSRRKAKGLNQKQLAEKIGVTVMTVSRWERGLVEPSLPGRRALAKELGGNASDYAWK